MTDCDLFTCMRLCELICDDERFEAESKDLCRLAGCVSKWQNNVAVRSSSSALPLDETCSSASPRGVTVQQLTILKQLGHPSAFCIPPLGPRPLSFSGLRLDRLHRPIETRAPRGRVERLPLFGTRLVFGHHEAVRATGPKGGANQAVTGESRKAKLWRQGQGVMRMCQSAGGGEECQRSRPFGSSPAVRLGPRERGSVARAWPFACSPDHLSSCIPRCIGSAD